MKNLIFAIILFSKMFLSFQIFSQNKNERFIIVNKEFQHNFERIKNDNLDLENRENSYNSILNDIESKIIDVYFVENIDTISLNDTDLIFLKKVHYELLIVNYRYMKQYVVRYNSSYDHYKGMIALDPDTYWLRPHGFARYIMEAYENDLQIEILSYPKKNGGLEYFARCFNDKKSYYLLEITVPPTKESKELYKDINDVVKSNTTRHTFTSIIEVLHTIDQM